MLTEENIAFLDSILLKIVDEADEPMFGSEIFHAFLDYMTPDSPIKDDVIEQNMLVVDVARDYTVSKRLVLLALQRKIGSTVLVLPNKNLFNIYYPLNTTVTNV